MVVFASAERVARPAVLTRRYLHLPQSAHISRARGAGARTGAAAFRAQAWWHAVPRQCGDSGLAQSLFDPVSLKHSHFHRRIAPHSHRHPELPALAARMIAAAPRLAAYGPRPAASFAVQTGAV